MQVGSANKFTFPNSTQNALSQFLSNFNQTLQANHFGNHITSS
jgi:hypothetical protein